MPKSNKPKEQLTFGYKKFSNPVNIDRIKKQLDNNNIREGYVEKDGVLEDGRRFFLVYLIAEDESLLT